MMTTTRMMLMTTMNEDDDDDDDEEGCTSAQSATSASAPSVRVRHHFDMNLLRRKSLNQICKRLFLRGYGQY